MAARVLDGKACAAQLRESVAARLALLGERGVTVGFAVVYVGDDPASGSYVRSLERVFTKAGVSVRAELLPADSSPERVRTLLCELSADPAIHGIMLQEPVPDQLDAEALALCIAPEKDIDGVHPQNAGKLFQGRSDGFVPATAQGGIMLLEREGVELSGKRAVVVGRSTIVGRPMALLLLHRHATVTICHSRTRDLAAVCREADVLAVGIGRAGFITPDMVKPGAVVVDFGTNFVGDQMLGDVDPAVAEVASALSPTPGGTGAVTTAVLLAGVVTAAERLANQPG
ncbi:MAG: bifunctional 5,10-methylenetetrahydrofolate dehydrogenase/5,10-methenyltetrahydrofolate cyclohydrolase [Armatimonadetes bacterium]|nr:bifunctional 5,10-methylenetetrahydrofolate dehydrogenase/5,10-methenyltetrahydrofolate cyclohydrolase [Armatimonadota bacterium]